MGNNCSSKYMVLSKLAKFYVLTNFIPMAIGMAATSDIGKYQHVALEENICSILKFDKE